MDDGPRTAADERLVTFLNEETGNTAHAVIYYDDGVWDFLYLSAAARSTFEEWGDRLDAEARDRLVEAFREDAARNQERRDVLGIGTHRCSLHLFSDLAVLHFANEDGQGIVFAHDAEAAANLSSFVDVCRPHVEGAFAARTARQ